MSLARPNWIRALALGGAAYLAARTAVRRARRLDLAGRLVLVTGGSRGLGLLIAREFAIERARVAIVARDADELARAHEMLRQQTGKSVWTAACDVADPAQVAATLDRLTVELGVVDVVVNNAGIITVGPAAEMTLDDYHRAMDVNFFGAVNVTQHLLPAMRRRRQGRIVNVTSIGGKMSVPHLLPYSASKFAAVGWSQGLRAELKRDDVYVTTVVPGLMRTGSPRNAEFKGRHQKEYAWFAIGDSLPLTSMSADRAARKIVAAAQDGVAQVTFPVNAWVAAKLWGIAPGLMSELAGWANYLLPSPGGIGQQSRTGRQSRSAAAPSVLTTLTERAAVDNNEIGAR